MIPIIFKYLTGENDDRESFITSLPPDQLNSFIKTIIDYNVLFDADLWEYASSHYHDDNVSLYFIIRLRQTEVVGG